MRKVLVIGLDGGTLSLVEPWVKQGKLPVMGSLMQNGGYSILRSVMPVLSSAAWPSFMTGVNPGKHGIYDFAQRDLTNYRLRLLRRDHIRAPSLWKLLSLQGKRVCVVNVPMTYPPEEVNGVLISGLGTPDTAIFSHPPELSRELTRRGYRVNKRYYFKPGDEHDYLNEIQQIAKRQFETSLWLMREQPWDFFMTVFFDIDQIDHFYWKYMDASHPAHPGADNQFSNAIFDFYSQIDSHIGELIAAAGADTDVIICSDHGTGPLYQDVFLNEWLRREGYLVLEDEVPQYRGMRRLFARLGITRREISEILKKLGLGRVETYLTRLLGDYVFILPRTRRAEFPMSIDWTHTRAYSFGYQGQIYVNLKGREPKGIVSPGPDFDVLLDEITEHLKSMVDPRDLLPVVDKIYRKEELFHGPFTHLAPDLTLIMRGLTYITRYGFENSPQPGNVFSDPTTYESGSHRYEGMLITAGPRASKIGMQPEGADIIDLAPTILHLLGCSIPTSMDGHVLGKYFQTNEPVEMGFEHPLLENSETPGHLTQEEEEEMMDRLRKMGYLE